LKKNPLPRLSHVALIDSLRPKKNNVTVAGEKKIGGGFYFILFFSQNPKNCMI
jgi:hypothetical protein